jgi:hypothetical protein
MRTSIRALSVHCKNQRLKAPLVVCRGCAPSRSHVLCWRTVKLDLLVTWFRALDGRLKSIGEGLEDRKRAGNPNVPWGGDSLVAWRQRVNTRMRQLLDGPGLLERVNRLIAKDESARPGK